MKTTITPAPALQAPHPLANGIAAAYDPTAKTHFCASHRKENNGFHGEIAALYSDPETQEMHAPVVLRLYWPGNTCYAALWVNGRRSATFPDGVHTSGTGKAGGGGYHKASAAAMAAITNAGFTLSYDIDGRGEGSMRDAVLAIAHALGFSGARLHYSHA